MGWNYGKKVLFLNPTQYLNHELCFRVFEHEFETYAVPYTQNIPKLLSTEEFKYSILFFTAQGETDVARYETDIRNLKKESASQELQYYIIYDCPEARGYKPQKNSQAELLQLDHDIKKDTQAIVSILEKNNARGRRQYTRCSCSHAKKNNVSLLSQNSVYRGSIVNLSVKALSCTLEKHRIEKNTLVDHITMRLENKDYTATGIVYNIYEGIEEKNNLYVILFDQPVKALHPVIYQCLQWQIASMIA